MTKVICLGEAMVELALDAAGPGLAAVGYAGDTFNTAVYLKRISPDLRVSYATRLGTDKLSGGMVEMMVTEGLETDLVIRDPQRLPGLYAISTDANGERSFMYWRSNSAARQMFAEGGIEFDDLVDADLLYLSAISLAILPEDHRSALIEWLPEYRARGGKFAFDSNYRPALWDTPDEARAAIEACWRQTDIALPSVDDECTLFEDSDEAAVIARLESFGVRSGALKRGGLGPRALDGGVADPFEAAGHVVDSTAAGDSFNAAYLAARLSGRDETDCLAAGHALAIRVIGARGAILPREEVPA